MNKNHFWSPMILLAICALTFGSLSGIAGAADQTLKVGKEGYVTFDVETKVGDLTLKPGNYIFEHRVVDGEHFVHFTEVTRPRKAGSVPVSHPGEVKCRLEPLDTKARQTIIIYANTEGSVARITRIIIKGENVAHVFDTVN
jgi:hypothetical protein